MRGNFHSRCSASPVYIRHLRFQTRSTCASLMVWEDRAKGGRVVWCVLWRLWQVEVRLRSRSGSVSSQNWWRGKVKAVCYVWVWLGLPHFQKWRLGKSIPEIIPTCSAILSTQCCFICCCVYCPNSFRLQAGTPLHKRWGLRIGDFIRFRTTWPILDFLRLSIRSLARKLINNITIPTLVLYCAYSAW